jgi:hypothetical protein
VVVEMGEEVFIARMLFVDGWQKTEEVTYGD